MRLFRIIVAEGAATFLKIVVMAFYSAWAVKLGFVESDINPLFAAVIVLLSIYGLWVVVRQASEFLVRSLDGNPTVGPARKG